MTDMQTQDSIESPIEANEEQASNTEETNTEAVETQEENKEHEKEIKKTLKALKIKFNGKELEEELPFEIPDDENVKEYMTKQLQLAKLSQTRAQEKAELEKAYESFIEELKSNPRKALANPKLGVDIKKMVAEVIEEEIEQSKKTPEQIEREKLLKEIEELKGRDKKREDDLRAAEKERLFKAETEKLDLMMTAALEKAGLPKTAFILNKVTDYMIAAHDEGYTDITPDEALKAVKKEVMDDAKTMVSSLSDDMLEEFFGKDILNRARKRNLAKAKTTPPVPLKAAVKDVGKDPAKKQEKAEPVSFKQFFGM